MSETSEKETLLNNLAAAVKHAEKIINILSQAGKAPLVSYNIKYVELIGVLQKNVEKDKEMLNQFVDITREVM